MIRYRVRVSTPYHGELFEARGDEVTIVALLAAAVAAVESIESELRNAHVPIAFEVDVYP